MKLHEGDMPSRRIRLWAIEMGRRQRFSNINFYFTAAQNKFSAFLEAEKPYGFVARVTVGKKRGHLATAKCLMHRAIL